MPNERQKLLSHLKFAQGPAMRAISAVLATSNKTVKRDTPKIAKASNDIRISGSENLGLTDKNIRELAGVFPGSVFKSVTFSKTLPPRLHHLNQGKTLHAVSQNTDDGIDLRIYIPGSNQLENLYQICRLPDLMALAFSRRHNLAHMDSVSGPAPKIIFSKDYRQIHKLKEQETIENDKWADYIYCCFRLTPDNGDWLDAYSLKLLSLGITDPDQIDTILSALHTHFLSLDEDADLNGLICEFNRQKQTLRQLSRHLELEYVFQNLHDKGLAQFIHRWLSGFAESQNYEDHDSLTHIFEIAQRQFTPEQLFLLEDAIDISEQAIALAAPGHHPKSKTCHEMQKLHRRIRRFNNSWNALEPGTKTSLKPFVLRAVHHYLNVNKANECDNCIIQL